MMSPREYNEYSGEERQLEGQEMPRREHLPEERQEQST